jgi:serine/threonine protein kinase
VSQAYLHELIMWRCLRHPNIVPFIGTSEQFPVSLVSEWMSGGTVTAFLREHPEEERSSIVSDHVDA